jgi:hypothetical protein
MYDKTQGIKSFWGGCIWPCIQCGSKIRNKDNFAIESDHVERLVEGDLEVQRRQHNP